MFGFPVLPMVLLFAGTLDLAISGGIYLYLDSLRRRCAEIRHKWRPVQAKILSSRLTQKQGDQGTLYTAEIRYEYSVDGTRYESDRISAYPKWSSSSREPHLKVVEQFPAGAEFTASVNPRKLSESVLLADPPQPKGIRIVLFILAGTGVATLIGGILVWALKIGIPA
jgi:hypothetical protein